jgi:alanine racemase
MTSPRLHLDLDALAHNFHLLRQRGSEALPVDQAAAVVKANAYGLGLDPIARRLWQEGCRRFFVAVAEEGIELRGVLPDARIYVLAGATAQTLDELTIHRLTPVLNTHHQCALWSQLPDPVPAALHIDTGMHRLGLPLDYDLRALPALELELVMTHFARADEWSNPMRREQLGRFAAWVPPLRDQFPGVLFSTNNSAAALSDHGASASELADVPRDIDRLGIGLYGVNPHIERDSQPAKQRLANVATLEAQVLQVRQVEAGAEVGYGSTYRVSEASRLATIGAGYADGIPRLLSNRGHVYFRGHRFPIVGRISMDSLVVELPDTEDCNLQEGEWVEIFGANLSVDDVAQQAETIAYEVYTGLGSRVRRLL